ncbi:bifunctional WXG100 family type VII secretion target/C40 family peptidase [Nonomuraea sp. SYSU D8015]|uniref:bifunctional WXG100 family type VII secretion target/C40 family peptidase n=1 Tax=Nonomuraea sp. SYSU D8015 TaxID=2593644 RepID=UPI0016613187|nr:NlpC/P60 family protein [Nonomuraea sp. SYSU D8015]
MDLTRISQLPSGAELVAIYTNITASDPDAIRDIATRWRGASGKVSDHAGRINRAVGNVDNAWNGASAVAFVEYMSKYRKAGVALQDALDSSASSLDGAAQYLATAKSRITSICQDMVDFEAENREKPDAAAKRLLEVALPAARDLEGKASSALTIAMRDISNQLKDRTPTFESIDSPTGEPWRPSRGNTVEWKPVTLPATTTFQGGNGYSPTSYTPGGGSPGSPGALADPGGAAPQPLPFTPGTGTGARIVQAARQHLGKPYVWGANGPSAFDCSGLVYYVLNQAGIKIGDTTAAGYQASGKPVSSPQPGDIVFFGNPAGHVGIYIGDGMMIHAPRSGSDVMVAPVAADGRSVSYRRFT